MSDFKEKYESVKFSVTTNEIVRQKAWEVGSMLKGINFSLIVNQYSD